MSIVIVTFRGAPQVNQEAIKQEEELDARIEAKIKGTDVCKYTPTLL